MFPDPTAPDPVPSVPSGSNDGKGNDGKGNDGSGEDTSKDGSADAVRTALNRARAAALARGLRPGTAAPGYQRRRRIPGENKRSGARPDARDPQTIGAVLDRLVAERGWEAPVAVGGVIGRWAAVVGADIAQHCQPLSFNEGVLVVQAESTAWATQVRLLVPALLGRLADEVGEGTVTKVQVLGPSAPSWRRGPRLAPGSQGPRDTYG